MELEERFKEIFAYLRRCECGCLLDHDVAEKLKNFIDEEELNYEKLPLKYQNKLSHLKKYHKALLIDMEDEESNL